MNIIYTWIILVSSVTLTYAQAGETRLTGVYRGKTLFIRNPYNAEKRAFCVSEISLNNKRLSLNYNLSAIKVDFAGIDENSPVSIHIIHSDSTCKPIIINPDAIAYHYSFSFGEISMNDSVLVWSSTGDHKEGLYLLDYYDYGFWQSKDTVLVKGSGTRTTYVHFPELQEGPNKLRLKYIFPSGDYVYSREIDFHYYEEPVTFTPKSSKSSLTLSRYANYEIYDKGNNMVLSGAGSTIDIRSLKRGDYIIYFDNKDPGVFSKL